MYSKINSYPICMNHFDTLARQWDGNPERLERSKAIAGKIITDFSGDGRKRALEYGAGTGTLSFMMQDYFSEIVMMDSAVEMVNVMEEKVLETGLTHLKPVFGNLEEVDCRDGNFDVIYSLMVMHHVKEIDLVLERFADIVAKGGSLVVVDLYEEDGSFHNDEFTGHLGFNPEKLKQKLEAAGFTSVNYHQCFIMHKLNMEGEIKDFPLFMMIGSR